MDTVEVTTVHMMASDMALAATVTASIMAVVMTRMVDMRPMKLY